MQIETLLDSIEQAVDNQLAIGDSEEVVENAAVALLAALRPAIRQASLNLAEQAANEVGAQLPDHTVSVVLEHGEPSLVVNEVASSAVTFGAEDLSARITLRLPDSLKDDIEAAANETGDSVNAFVVKALASRAAKKGSRHITETYET